MEINKENMRKGRPITRIPLPVEPLPPLPKYLIQFKGIPNKENHNERHPLKAINSGKQPQLTLPGSSKHVNYIKQHKNVLKLDTRFVTLRSKDEVKTGFNVFKDNKRKDSIVVISDEEDSAKPCKERRKSCDTAATPAFKSTLEPCRVKNIKRSLKRPHSRELQGLSPVAKEKKEDEKARRRLYFTESMHDKLKSPDYWKKAQKSIHQVYVADIFTHLLGVEQKVETPRISSAMRACIINWLMKVNGAHGNPGTVQTACWYLDSVLATGQLHVDKLQLIAAACYWIASKFHGPGLHASKLVKCSNYAFNTQGLLSAEKAVLEKLKFPRQPVIPQEFIAYLSWWCDSHNPGEIEIGATFICMCGVLADKQHCGEFPSVIAVAAVQNALLLLGKVELIPRLEDCPLFRSIEKKAESLSYTCSLLRRAVRTVGSITFEYKTPYEHYGVPPFYFAQTILYAANGKGPFVPESSDNKNIVT